MSRPSQTRWIRNALLALGLALAGCGETPITAPGPDAGAAPQLIALSDGATAFVAPPDMTALASGTMTQAGVTSSATINGAVGGRLTCGRFAVTVLPGTFSGTGTVTMTMPDPTVSVVDLSISPSTLNSFKVAVALSYDPSGLALTAPVTIYWFDGKKWVDLVAKADSKTGLPTVSLKHFSPYGAGKAGW